MSVRQPEIESGLHPRQRCILPYYHECTVPVHPCGVQAVMRSHRHGPRPWCGLSLRIGCPPPSSSTAPSVRPPPCGSVCPWLLVLDLWSLVPGIWSVILGPWSLVLGAWSSVLGHWPLVLGPSSLVLGPWCWRKICWPRTSGETLGQPLLDQPVALCGSNDWPNRARFNAS